MRKVIYKCLRGIYVMNKMINENDLLKAHEEFNTEEERAKYYPLFSNLIKGGYEKEAFLLILATWNSGCFRFAKKFNLEEFTEKLESLEKYFNRLKYLDFKTVLFEEHKEEITKIFDELSDIDGVKYTGASKIMHLKNPNLFVMWDFYISGQAPKKLCPKNYIKYEQSGQGYFNFLKKMKQEFGSLNSPVKDITLAKAVDEYNYVNITLPIMKKEKEQRKLKKAKQKLKR